MHKPDHRSTKQISDEKTACIIKRQKRISILSLTPRGNALPRVHRHLIRLLSLLLVVISTLSPAQAEETGRLPDKATAAQQQQDNRKTNTIGPEVNAYDQGKAFEAFNPQSRKYEYGLFGTQIMKSRPGDGSPEAQFLAMILVDDDLKKSWKNKGETINSLERFSPAAVENVESLLQSYRQSSGSKEGTQKFIRKARGLIHMLSNDNPNALRSVQFSQVEVLRRGEYKDLANIEISPKRQALYKMAGELHDKGVKNPSSDIGKLYQSIRNGNSLRGEFKDLKEEFFQNYYLVPETGGEHFYSSLIVINHMLLNIFHRHYLSKRHLDMAGRNYEGSPEYYRILNEIAYEYYAFLHDIGSACEKDLDSAMTKLYSNSSNGSDSNRGNMALSLVQTLSMSLRLRNNDETNDEINDAWGEHKGYDIPLERIWTDMTVVTPDYMMEQISKKDETINSGALLKFKKMRSDVPKFVRYIAECIRKAHTNFQLITDREKSPEDFQQELDFYIMDYDDYVHREAIRYGHRRHRKLRDAANQQ